MRVLLAILTSTMAFAYGADKTYYNNLKTQAKNAVASGDLAAAERSYRELLTLAEASHQGSYELYSNVVTPLADIYKRQEQSAKLEALYAHRVEMATQTRSEAGLELGMAQADLGFFYQNSEVSADKFHGERYIEEALNTFEGCAQSKQYGSHCERRLADTAGIQGSIYFQKQDYTRAEPLFRRVVAMPEKQVQPEVLFISLHALRGILILRKEVDEARELERRAAVVEARNVDAVARLKGESQRARTQHP